MPDNRFDSIAIPIAAARSGELRVRLPSERSSELDLAIFRDPRAAGAEASVRLTRDGARALIHALQTALDEAGETREQTVQSPEGQDWWANRAQAA